MARHNPSYRALAVTSHHQFRLGERWVAYTLKRSPRRRSITFSINEAGLRVGAPRQATQRSIETLIDAHGRWIVRKLDEWQARKPPAFRWQPGAILMALGVPLRLTLAPESSITERQGQRLCLAAAAEDADTLAGHAIGWLRDTAQSWFEQRAAHYAGVLNVPMPAIRLSNAKTRWGACHPTGRVHLNWKLVQVPPRLIDYVIVHELAHLREPNHSRRFWQWVAHAMPDYEERRRTLRLEAHRYVLP